MTVKMPVVIAAVMAGVWTACGADAEAAKAAEGSPRALKVLMIGNSFSICVGYTMPQVAKSMGLDLELCSLYIGGCPLKRHWENWVAGTNADFRPYRLDRYVNGRKTVDNGKANIPEALGFADWDIVTFQQASDGSWRSETYQPYAADLQAAIRARLPKVEFVWQETWSYTPWDGRLKKWGIDQTGMYEKLHAAYAANAKGQRIIPTGTAVQLWRKQLPVAYRPDSLGGDLCGADSFEKQADGTFKHKGDACHLNKSGEYLQALVWTAKLYGVDVRTCAYAPKFIPAEKAELMKRVAMEAVAQSAK